MENTKNLRKEFSEELMPAARHPIRWWYWCMSEDEKKEIDPMFIEELQKCVSVLYNMGILKHFVEGLHW